VAAVELGIIKTKIPSRLDRLPWSRFHWRIILGLGTAWILDGLEVTIVGSVRLPDDPGGQRHPDDFVRYRHRRRHLRGRGLLRCPGLRLPHRPVWPPETVYDHAWYLHGGHRHHGVSFSPWFFWIFRFLTGTGIGGEYAAVNSAIDELIPARARGGVDLVINGSFWVGSIIGSALVIFFLDTAIFPAGIGWRLSFAIGIILGSAVLLVRRHVPESPRWLFIHGRDSEAEALVDGIEAEVTQETGPTWRR